MSLRPNWRTSATPLDMRLPVDSPVYVPTDWEAAWADTSDRTYYRDDFLDRLNPTKTWGSTNPGETGGSGICFARPFADLDAVIVADRAMHQTTPKPDDEHRIRLLQDPIMLCAMIRDPKPLRRIVEYADEAKSRWGLDCPVVPNATLQQFNVNVAQFLQMAQRGIPMPGYLGRAFGWIMWGEAMALKVQPGRSRAFGEACLHLCELAANPWTGQIVYDSNPGINETDITYCEHWGISMMGALALSHRLGWDVPIWVLTAAERIYEQPVLDYYGGAAPPKFLRTQDQQLMAATGTAQGGDPACGFYEELCAALYHLTRDWTHLERSCKFGIAAQSVDEKAERLAALTDAQAKRLTVLLRGILT